MKIELTDKELDKYLSLQQDELDLQTCEIKTTKGKVVGSKIKTKDEAIKHANKHLITIVKTFLK